ncbi:MAG: hypothetical protein JNK87_08455 [Bryobacterales bacterium]|nr:hypothetical protein [Bryobacterales bacterium]
MANGITSIVSPSIVWGARAGGNVRLWMRGALLIVMLAICLGADHPAWSVLLTQAREMAAHGAYQQALTRAQMALQ